jgi:four helix bundle protein
VQRVNIDSYRDLIVWQRSVELVTEIYKFIVLLPENENYCLCSQIRRSAVSIPSNIAEGYGRGVKDYVRFLKMARGSLFELETQLLIAANLFGKINVDVNGKCKEIEKMLNTMIKRLS